jgi:TRAP-type C4-dicarboxylate transport system permease small subunit
MENLTIAQLSWIAALVLIYSILMIPLHGEWGHANFEPHEIAVITSISQKGFAVVLAASLAIALVLQATVIRVRNNRELAKKARQQTETATQQTEKATQQTERSIWLREQLKFLDEYDDS